VKHPVFKVLPLVKLYLISSDTCQDFAAHRTFHIINANATILNVIWKLNLTEGAVWGSASSCRAPPTAEEMDPA
jgi:hypothetical protein